MAYGYRFHEVGLTLQEVKKDVVITVDSAIHPFYRSPVMQSLYCHVFGACLPHPDHNDQNSAIAGVLKRMGRKTPQPEPSHPHHKKWKHELKNIKRFTYKFCKRHFVPCDFDHDFAFMKWVRERAGYPLWRQEELIEAYKNLDTIDEKHAFVVKCFIKDEKYGEYKHDRAISARRDEAKTILGPFFQPCYDELKKHHSIIKDVPVKDRPGYISEILEIPGGKYISTDYTAFESHFTRDIMHNVEFVFYKYMLQNVPDKKYFYRLLDEYLAGRNNCQFKRFNLKIDATRMSGEMNTSLGNTFSNLILMLYICEKKHITVDGVVEGDDGLFRCYPRAPTAADFEEIGFTIKLQEHSELRTASFCGIVFDEIDKLNVTNPIEYMCSFGWSKLHYVRARRTRLMELLKSKSLSTAFQYPGCPIIQSLAFYGLRMTKHIDISRYLEKERSVDMYERTRIEQAIEAYKMGEISPVQVPMRTRLLVKELYGVSVEDQLAIETYLDEKQDLSEIKHVSILKYCSHDWQHFFANYVSNDMGNYPVLAVPEYKNELGPYSKFIKFTRKLIASGLSTTVYRRTNR